MIKITMNGNGHNNAFCNLIIKQLLMNSILINCWIMRFFNIIWNDCSELSGFMFTVNVLFQIISPLYLMPALDQLEEADGTCRWLAVLVL